MIGLGVRIGNKKGFLSAINDYYVRPAGGPYGDADGTSYADAWAAVVNIDWGLLVDGTLLAFSFADGSIVSGEPTATIKYINGIGSMQIGETFTII